MCQVITKKKKTACKNRAFIQLPCILRNPAHALIVEVQAGNNTIPDADNSVWLCQFHFRVISPEKAVTVFVPEALSGDTINCSPYSLRIFLTPYGPVYLGERRDTV